MPDQGSNSNTVWAAGAVLWRHAHSAGEDTPLSDGGAPVEVALVHRPRYDDWSLPKGKLNDGETVAHCAIREVAEETGFTARLSRQLGSVQYPAPRPPGWRKFVVYFSARAGDGSFSPNVEVDQLRWLSIRQASELATHDGDRGILARFAALPAKMHTVLLVRHAKAGSRANWQGDDALRPLSNTGKQQAEALRTMLPLFGPERISSAPPLRCLQTVETLAADLNLSIGAEPLLSEEAYWDAPEAGLARFLEIAGLSGTSVVSSQGGVIPDLVKVLAARSRLHLGWIGSKKSSVWAMFLLWRDRTLRLAAADYYPSPLSAPLKETPSKVIH